jgi:PPK2 family polyphosphate:nucleotide phosphotransferase
MSQLARLMIIPGERTNLFQFDFNRRGNVVEMPARTGEAKWRSDLPVPLDLRQQFVIAPGTRVKLGEIDPGFHASYESAEAAGPIMQCLTEQLDRLQCLMYAEKRHSLLIVLQGLDASGKDGVVRHLLRAVNPMGCRLAGFKQPKPEELDHDFLWRVHPHLPGKGEIAIFNRSHYEDVLVVRVHGVVPAEYWWKRYDLINDFERLIAMENNTTILKFYLHISKKEQLARFKQRLEDPARQWKISEADYHERTYWPDYMKAFEDMLHRTSTQYAPWFVIPADQKWFRDLAISQVVTRTLEKLNMQCPIPTVDIAAMRRRYHDAEAEEGDC